MRLRKHLLRFAEHGQSTLMYGLLLACIALVSMAVINSLNDDTNELLNGAGSRITTISQQPGNDAYISTGSVSPILANVYDYSGYYDDDYHTGTVEVVDPASGYSLMYGTENGIYTTSIAPTYKDVGSYRVYFEITAPGYTSLIGHYDVDIYGENIQVPTVTGNFIYNGQLRTPVISEYDDSIISVSGVTSATDAGTYSITFTLLDTENYAWFDGTSTPKERTWSIAKYNLAESNIATIANQYYTGSPITPNPMVTANGVTLTRNTDYTVSYANNTHAGTATLTVTAVNGSNYTGSKSASFTIMNNNMTVQTTNYSGTYDGASHTGTITVTGPSGCTITYRTSASGTYNLTTKPNFTDAGAYTVYFRVEADNYNDFEGSFTVTINRKAIAAVPSQSGSLYYTGSTQYPTWSGYNSAEMTYGGTSSGVNIGTYTATFTPLPNYKWADGTTTGKNVSWEIKASTGTKYYTLTLNGTDRNGNPVAMDYNFTEVWDKINNCSYITLTSIQMQYYRSASNSYVYCATTTGGSIGHDSSWSGRSYWRIKDENTRYVNINPASGNTDYIFSFSGSTGTLTYLGQTYTASFTIPHDDSGNAKLYAYGYWSWSTSGSYPLNTRSGIVGSTSGTLTGKVVSLTNTK